MATAVQQQPQPIPAPPLTPHLITAPSCYALKIGIFGPQGSGKSASSALILAAISALYCNRAPIFVVDPEDGWPFLDYRIFKTEGIELIRRPYRSFKSMAASIHEADKLGCCGWIVDPLTLHWNELMDTYKGSKGFVAIDQWQDIRKVWNDLYIAPFLLSKMTCIASGRLGNDFEEREEQMQNGNTKTKLIKVGTKFKAGGGESFGYEPHLLLEVSQERKAKKVQGEERIGEGRMIHRVDVLKDRTWALNGQTIRWPDRPGYGKGDFKHTWNSILPHFQFVQMVKGQLSGGAVAIGSDTSDALIVTDAGQSDYYRLRQRRDTISREVTETLDHLFGGTSQDAKHTRREVTRHIFDVISKETAAELPIDKVERGLHILQAFEKRCKADEALLTGKELNILANLDIDIQQHDQGVAEEQELPF
jgi:hypothetical protein